MNRADGLQPNKTGLHWLIMMLSISDCTCRSSPKKREYRTAQQRRLYGTPVKKWALLGGITGKAFA
jgi:hypothetical protein